MVDNTTHQDLPGNYRNFMNHHIVKLKIPKVFLQQSNKEKENHLSSLLPTEEVVTKKAKKSALNEAPSHIESDGVATKKRIAKKNKTTKDKKKKKRQVSDSEKISKKKISSPDEGTVTTSGTKTTAAETLPTNDRSSTISTRKDDDGNNNNDDDDESTSISGILTMVKDHDRYRHGYNNDKDDHHSYGNTYDDLLDDGGQYSSSDDDGINKTTTATTTMNDPKRYLSSFTETLVQRESTLGRYNYLTAESYKELGEIYLQLVCPSSVPSPPPSSTIRSRISRSKTAALTPSSKTKMQADPHSIHRAVILFRSYYRIQLILYGTTAPIPIAPSSQSPTTTHGLYKALLCRNYDGKDDALDNPRGGGGGKCDYSKLSYQPTRRQRFDDVQSALIESVRFELDGDLKRRFGLKTEAAVEYTKAARIEEAAFGRENPDVSSRVSQ